MVVNVSQLRLIISMCFCVWQFVQRLYKPTDEELNLRSQKSDLKMEQEKISMADHFAAYMKLQRRIDKLSQEIKQLGKFLDLYKQVNEILWFNCFCGISISIWYEYESTSFAFINFSGMLSRATTSATMHLCLPVFLSVFLPVSIHSICQADGLYSSELTIMLFTGQ